MQPILHLQHTEPILHLQHTVCPYPLATVRARSPWCLLGVLALLLSASPAMAEIDQGPEGLSASDWSGILAAYEAKRHEAFAAECGYVARNPGQQWQTNFDGHGFDTTPDAGGWSWGLELERYGTDGAERAVGRPKCVEARGSRIEYQWNDNLTEWYVNDARGLEHGYTIHKRSGAGTTKSQHKNWAFTLAVRGGLLPRVCVDGQSVAFVNDAGTSVISYTGLSVYDATGANVPAWFESAPSSQASSPGPHAIRIVIDDAEAAYPLTVDPIAQQAYLKASNPDIDDEFGRSVAVSGDTVVIGAWIEDSNATGVNGDQANNSASRSGAAYVFVRSGGVWTQQAYLKASNTEAGDQFGWSVSVSGDTVVVGAYNESSNATGVNGDQANNIAGGSGAAYVFARTGGVWSQQAYLKASNTGAFDRFGFSVAVSGDTIVVGADSEDSNATGVDGNGADNSANTAGAAYVFFRTGTTWSQQAYLKASNSAADDTFGTTVAVSGDTVVVGAHQEDSNATGVNGDQANNSALSAGAAYVFVRSGGLWGQQAYLKASNTEAFDRFGESVAVSGDTVVVGSPNEDSNSTGVNGNQANNSASASGAAYVFARSGGVWSQQAYLKATNTNGGDAFGRSVAASGDTLVVGAPFEGSNATGVNGNQDDNSAGFAGAAYAFIRSGGIWSQQAYFKASNTEANDWFGLSLAVSGDTVVVGALQEDSNATGVNGNQGNNSAGESGAAYVFVGVGCPTLGNMNCDCELDLLDVDAFVLALLDPAGYAIAYPGCDILRGDMQPDGNVDGLDVRGFLGLLIP